MCRTRRRLPASAHDPSVCKHLDDVSELGACYVHFERLTDGSGLPLVDDDVALGIHLVTNGQRLAAILALFRCLLHASDDLLPEIGGVILGQTFQHALQDDRILQVVLRERLQLALLPALFVPALVISVHFPQLSGAGLCADHRAAIPAEHFTAQQIVHLRPPCRIVAARLKVLGSFQEGRLVDDRLHV